MLAVAEVLRHSQTRLSDSHTRARRLVHLTENERSLADNARFLHLVPEVVALTRTLSDAREYRIAAVLGGDIADKLLYEDGLADACAAEKSYFTALSVGRDEVDDLDARLEYLDNGALLLKRRSLAVYAPFLLGHDVALLVDRLAEDVEHTSEGLLADGHLYARARSSDLHILAESLTCGEHDTAHDVVAHMLSDLHNAASAVDLNGESVPDHGELSRGELNVYNRSDDLSYLTFFHIAVFLQAVILRCFRGGLRPLP